MLPSKSILLVGIQLPSVQRKNFKDFPYISHFLPKGTSGIFEISAKKLNLAFFSNFALFCLPTQFFNFKCFTWDEYVFETVTNPHFNTCFKFESCYGIYFLTKKEPRRTLGCHVFHLVASKRGSKFCNFVIRAPSGAYVVKLSSE